MITIDINSFWSDQEELKNTCIDVIQKIAGVPHNISVWKEDDNDDESNYSLFFSYQQLDLTDFDVFDEIKSFVIKNELYVVIYDHDTKIRIGYWFDEEPRWIKHAIGDYKPYQDSVLNHTKNG